MKKELELKLIGEFPTYFSDYGGDMRKTCMHWGCSHGDGWFDIIWDCCTKLREAGISDFKFSQIKEKFGTLRLYYRSNDRKADPIIDEACKRSEHTCELCGSTENTTTEGWWLQTLCPTCRTKDKKR